MPALIVSLALQLVEAAATTGRAPPPPSLPDLRAASALRASVTFADVPDYSDIDVRRLALEAELRVVPWATLFGRLPLGSASTEFRDGEDDWEEDVFGNVSAGARVLTSPFASPVTLAFSARALFATASFETGTRYYGDAPPALLDGVFMAEHPYDFHPEMGGGELRADARWTDVRFYLQLGAAAFVALDRGEELELDYVRAGLAAGVPLPRGFGAALEVNEILLPPGDAVTAVGGVLRYLGRRASLGLRLHRHLHGPLHEALAIGVELDVSTR